MEKIGSAPLCVFEHFGFDLMAWVGRKIPDEEAEKAYRALKWWESVKGDNDLNTLLQHGFNPFRA